MTTLEQLRQALEESLELVEKLQSVEDNSPLCTVSVEREPEPEGKIPIREVI